MTGYCAAEAVVLNSIDYGESDKIVTFYTLEFGKLKGIAKGAKRSKKRFVNNLEPFSHIRLLFFQKPGRDLAMLEQADVLGRFDTLFSDIDRLAFGSYCLELLSEMTPEGQTNQKAFELLLKFLIMLDAGANIRTMVMFFEMQLLSILGYHPHLDRCVICKQEPSVMISSPFIPLQRGTPFLSPSGGGGGRTPLQDTKLFFSSARSGILCSACKEKETERFTNHRLIPVSPGAIKFLMLAAKTDVDKADRIAMPDWGEEECKKVMDDFLRYHLGKELKSKRFLEKINFEHRNSNVKL